VDGGAGELEYEVDNAPSDQEGDGGAGEDDVVSKEPTSLDFFKPKPKEVLY
jgi:hypothetical protein